MMMRTYLDQIKMDLNFKKTRNYYKGEKMISIKEENKHNFFLLRIQIGDKFNEQKTIMNDVDRFLAKVSIKQQPYIFISSDKRELNYFFRTQARKREGQLIRLMETVGENRTEFKFYSFCYSVFNKHIKDLNENTKFRRFDKIQKSLLRNPYNRFDIEVLDTYSNWRPWQKDIYNKMFVYKESLFPLCHFKRPDFRKITLIYDEIGCTGKSILWKWLVDKNQDGDVFQIPFGTASQLRARVTKHACENPGGARLYIVDIPRSSCLDKYDSEISLLSVLEQVKTGFLTNSMYGSTDSIMINPPWIIISTNFLFDPNLLSKDRWEIFRLSKSNLRLNQIPIRKLKVVNGIKKHQTKLKNVVVME